MLKYIIAILASIIIIYSCKSKNGYLYEQKGYYNFEPTYNRNDSLYLSDYILYSLHSKSGHDKFGSVNLNDDSLFNIFKASLKRLDLPIKYNTVNNNKLTDEFIRNHFLKYKNIDKEYIKRMTKQLNGKTAVIPIILKLFNKFTNVSSGGADTYPSYICHFSLAVFIIKNNKIIYYKQMRHVESVYGEFHPYKYEDFHIPIPHEHWDGLVREVMKEYIERMK